MQGGKERKACWQKYTWVGKGKEAGKIIQKDARPVKHAVPDSGVTVRMTCPVRMTWLAISVTVSLNRWVKGMENTG
jgi:hypothetical protein